MRIAVLGAGSWGTALANLLAANHHEVVLWSHEPRVAEAVKRHHENPDYLPGCSLDPNLDATADLAAAVDQAAMLVSAVPSHVTRAVLGQVHAIGATPEVLACASKGIETDTLKLMSEVSGEALPSVRFVALSGPSFAQEVAAGEPTAIVAAGEPGPAKRVQDAFATPRFRVYTQTDVVGVEVGGALKNVIAIAAGVLVGLGMGHNPRAALVTRGLAEMTRLGVALGGRPATFAGLAGIGDLVLTTGGPLSRNRSLGEALARGEGVADWQASHRAVAEGVNTTRAALALAARHGVELPITAEVHALLFEGKSPRRAVRDLMERDLKPELAG